MSFFEELKKKAEYAASPEGTKEASEFLGLPEYEKMLERTRSGQLSLTPLEVMGMAGRPIESVTAAPARAAISSLQGNLDLGEAMRAFANQFGRNVDLAPTGAQIAEKAGLQGKAAAAAGLGLDIAIDPSSIMGGAALKAGAAMKALPLLGLAGTVAKAGKIEKAAEVGSVLAKQDPLGFYSKLEDVILSKMGRSATPEQVMSIAKGAKEEEVAVSGLADFLKGKEKVTQEEVLQQIRKNRPQLTEKRPFPTKFDDYQEPGGLNYREILIALPDESAVSEVVVRPSRIQGKWDVVDEGGHVMYTGTSPEDASEYIQELGYVRNADLKTNRRNYYTGHWDEPNVLAHARVNERVDKAGKKLLHVEEIQSDWHQKGREIGYKSGSSQSGVPDAPFKKNWMELMAKRLIRQAVDSGADRMSWTPGAKQAARYNLSKQVSRIEYEPYSTPQGDNLYELLVYDKKGKQIYSDEDINIQKVEEIIGKGLARKIEAKQGRSLESERPNRPDWMSLEGLDLEVGGEGMKGFYDKMLPDFLRKFGKKYGAEVGETTADGMKVPFLELTPALKKAVKEEGLPLFKVGVSAGMPALMEKMRRDRENRD